MPQGKYSLTLGNFMYIVQHNITQITKTCDFTKKKINISFCDLFFNSFMNRNTHMTYLSNQQTLFVTAMTWKFPYLEQFYMFQGCEHLILKKILYNLENIKCHFSFFFFVCMYYYFVRQIQSPFSKGKQLFPSLKY